MNFEEKELKIILKKLKEKTGYDFSQYRQGTIKRRIAKRLWTIGVKDIQTYITILERDLNECKRLIQELTIKVSQFFRNPYVFEILNIMILPEILEIKKKQKDCMIRIWSAGCAYGEEAYSIAMLLMEHLKQKKIFNDYKISIFATDIDEKALIKAKQGIYDEEAVLEVKKKFLDKYFIYNGLYKVTDEIKQLVNFYEHDVTSQRQIAPPGGVICNYDMILCRNLLIYLSDPLQKRVISNFSKSLNPGGYLILGESEYIPKEFEEIFILKDRHGKIYQKRY
ncbi:MAG TPA: protein-glutamate O-methyltransferase CheR [Candidatus Desulfofervidus auxilii]|uniref:protein-glutamate O-methyltransferase n=1 Tax=Desulfofervidus auxilii TaxID=1621989 RepID=A0A7C0U3Z8_DESA2|nr:protein-glutamate O-methyltransferase CheR [Candidatus Desulfofervidus auxilii]